MIHTQTDATSNINKLWQPKKFAIFKKKKSLLKSNILFFFRS